MKTDGQTEPAQGYRRHRLIGVIEQPAQTLDREELVLHINTLARECDRFEYKLLGKDRE